MITSALWRVWLQMGVGGGSGAGQITTRRPDASDRQFEPTCRVESRTAGSKPAEIGFSNSCFAAKQRCQNMGQQEGGGGAELDSSAGT